MTVGADPEDPLEHPDPRTTLVPAIGGQEHRLLVDGHLGRRSRGRGRGGYGWNAVGGEAPLLHLGQVGGAGGTAVDAIGGKAQQRLKVAHPVALLQPPVLACQHRQLVDSRLVGRGLSGGRGGRLAGGRTRSRRGGRLAGGGACGRRGARGGRLNRIGKRRIANLDDGGAGRPQHRSHRGLGRACRYQDAEGDEDRCDPDLENPPGHAPMLASRWSESASPHFNFLSIPVTTAG